MRRRILAVTAMSVLLAACSGGDDEVTESTLAATAASRAPATTQAPATTTTEVEATATTRPSVAPEFFAALVEGDAEALAALSTEDVLAYLGRVTALMPVEPNDEAGSPALNDFADGWFAVLLAPGTVMTCATAQAQVEFCVGPGRTEVSAPLAPVVDGRGIGAVEFGASGADIEAELAPILGEPTSVEAEQTCLGPETHLRWGEDVTVGLIDDIFASYTIVTPFATAVGGAQVGMTLEQLEARYGAELTVGESQARGSFWQVDGPSRAGGTLEEIDGEMLVATLEQRWLDPDGVLEGYENFDDQSLPCE